MNIFYLFDTSGVISTFSFGKRRWTHIIQVIGRLFSFCLVFRLQLAAYGGVLKVPIDKHTIINGFILSISKFRYSATMWSELSWWMENDVFAVGSNVYRQAKACKGVHTSNPLSLGLPLFHAQHS